MMDRKQQIVSIIEHFNAIHRKIMKIIPYILNELGISRTQMFILNFVKQNEDTSIKEVAHAMGITSSAATQQVNTLVEKGYLVREENDIDRRQVKIRLSPDMDKKIEKNEAVVIEQLCAFFDGISDKDLEQFYNMHKKITQHILDSTLCPK